MQVTKELIQNDIVAMNSQLETLKAQVAQTTGALSTLQGILAYMEAPDPVPPTAISDENKAVQDALTLRQVAEAVAGPGAVAEEPEQLPPTSPVGEVVDARGMYHPVEGGVA